MKTLNITPTSRTGEDPDPTLKPGHATRKFLRAAGYGLGGLLLLALLVSLVVNAIANRRLEGELAKVREKGEPLTMTEAAPPPVPDAENAALLYPQVFDLLPRTRSRTTGDGIQRKELAPDDSKVLQEFLSDQPSKQGPVRPEQVRRVLNGTEPALALARKTAAMPRVRFPVKWEDGAGALLPHYSQLRDLVRLLAADALLATQESRADRAYEDVTAMIGVSRHTLSDPILVGQLTGYATLAITSRTLERVMEAAPPDPAQARELARAIAEVDVTGRFVQSLITERALGVWAFNLAGKDPGQFLQSVGSGSELTAPAAGSLTFGLGWLARPFVKLDQAFYLPYMSDQIERAKKGGRETPSVSNEGVPFPRYAVVSRLLMPAFARAADKRDEALARLALDRWGLALQIHKSKAGRYPATLREASPSIGGDLPGDPFTGRPLTYRLRGDGYLLYSVGANGKDDGGESRKDIQNPEGSPPSGTRAPDDIAWKFKA